MRESKASLEIHEALSPKRSRKNITFNQRSRGLTGSKLYIVIINFTRKTTLRPLEKVKRLFERLKTPGPCLCYKCTAPAFVSGGGNGNGA